jgi:hypothetical protein
MVSSRLVAVAIVIGSLVAACAGESEATRAPQPYDNPPLRQRPTVLGSGADMNMNPPPPPQDMPGKGRSTAGKP